MRTLLGVNVLLALLDADHVDHVRARAFLQQEIQEGWASFVITQNGFVRVISRPNLPQPRLPERGNGPACNRLYWRAPPLLAL